MGVRKKITPPPVGDPEVETLGPAMLSLTEQQRRFVVAYTMAGHQGATAAARAAGYSDNEDAAKVRAFHLLRNPKVADALKEWTATAVAGRGAFIGLQALEAIAQDAEHRDQFKAAATLLAIAGFAAKTEHQVTVTDERSDRDVIGSILGLANQLGIDARPLLGRAGADVIDVEAVEAESGE